MMAQNSFTLSLFSWNINFLLGFKKIHFSPLPFNVFWAGVRVCSHSLQNWKARSTEILENHSTENMDGLKPM